MCSSSFGGCYSFKVLRSDPHTQARQGGEGSITIKEVKNIVPSFSFFQFFVFS